MCEGEGKYVAARAESPGGHRGERHVIRAVVVLDARQKTSAGN